MKFCTITSLMAVFPSMLSIDTHDFLNANYLPYTLMLESNVLDSTNTTSDNSTTNGDKNNAFNTMRYHRSMINEYLCHNFVAKEILEEFGLQGYIAEDRVGVAAEARSKISPSIDQIELLNDAGSNNYKNWLAKSAILNDIYKRYDMPEEDSSQVFASGDITGYAIQTNEENSEKDNHETESKHNYIPFKSTHHYHDNVLNMAATNPELNTYTPHEDYQLPVHSFGYSGHSVPEYSYNFGHHPSTYSSGIPLGYENMEHYNTPIPHPPIHYHGDEEKGLALKDLFNLALTALAFLAFGMFVLNLIMACFAVPGATVVMQMTQDSMGADDNTDNRRTKRATNGMTKESLNRLTYYVLTSIDALTMLQEDKVQEDCLKRSLCESNRYSRSLPTNQQIWVPVWSFAVSWISGNIIDHDSRLENLRAVFLGLGKANCKSLYNKCQ